MDLFPDIKSLASSGYLFRITDNCGDTEDRYTVMFCDGDYLTLSGIPGHSQGVSQFGKRLDPNIENERVEEGGVIDLALGDLPPGSAEHIRQRLNEAWQSAMNDLESGLPDVIALSRSLAEINEGGSESGGKGIYRTLEGYMVHNDSGPDMDSGPFDNVRDVMRATLPTPYSLSGPEFHSGIEVNRLVPTPGVAEAVAARETALMTVNGLLTL